MGGDLWIIHYFFSADTPLSEKRLCLINIEVLLIKLRLVTEYDDIHQ